MPGQNSPRSIVRQFTGWRGEIRHDQIRQVVCFVDTMNGDHVVVQDCRGRLGFSRESLPRCTAAGQNWREHLDGDVTIE